MSENQADNAANKANDLAKKMPPVPAGLSAGMNKLDGEGPAKCCSCIPWRIAVVILCIVEALNALNGLSFFSMTANASSIVGILYVIFAVVVIVLAALSAFLYGRYLLRTKDGKNDSKANRGDVEKGLNFYILKILASAGFWVALLVISLVDDASGVTFGYVVGQLIGLAINLLILMWWRSSCQKWISEA